MNKTSSANTIEGKVTKFDTQGKFGFIHSEDLEVDVFFHLDDVPGKPSTLRVGSRLSGVVAEGEEGPKLTKIKVLSLQSTSPYQFYIIIALTITVLVTGLVWKNFEVPLIGAYMIGINAGTIFFMGLDKSLARSGSIRTPEAIVYTMALLGGSPGVLLGTHVFKHKTRKAGFHFVLLLIVVVQLFVLRYLGIELGPQSL